MEVLVAPIKSESDKKSYRIIRLSNQLKFLLISDQVKQSNGEEKYAKFCLSVKVGSFSDPQDVQGMAHFIGENIGFTFSR